MGAISSFFLTVSPFPLTVEDPAAPRPRRCYHLTDSGRRQLAKKETEWRTYAGAMLRVLEGGEGYA